MKQDDIHALTVAEISRQVGEYNCKRRAVSAELAKIYAARKKGASAEQPLTDHMKAARERAKAMLNGNSGAILNLPPDATREQELWIEADAIDLVLKALSRSELVARAAEGAKWSEKISGEWRELCRQTTLAKIRLENLERRAAEMLQEGGPFAGRLPMTQFVGRSLDGVPAADVAAAAITEGIVTKAEIKTAQEV